MAEESVKETSGVKEGDRVELHDGKPKQRGILSRIWHLIFRTRRDDFEKRLQHISKEEAFVVARIKRRSLNLRKSTRHLIFLSVLSESIAVGYAIMTTRTLDLNWKIRAFRVLPMFLFPVLSFAFYSTIVSVIKICDRKDQKTLKNLRDEMKAKIDELKEKTNYYTTQQLIQRYDTDPAAKAAAATVLASKLGAESGLKLFVGDEQGTDPILGRSRDVDPEVTGLRNRKQSSGISTNEDGTVIRQDGNPTHGSVVGRPGNPIAGEGLTVEHYQSQGSTPRDSGWVARIAAFLVGEDPAESYALICGNCHMHNGLAKKEDFEYVTYFCPHCNALNRPKAAVVERELLLNRGGQSEVDSTTLVTDSCAGGITVADGEPDT